MKTIPITKGQVALVDDEDYSKVANIKWYAQKSKNSFYAVTYIYQSGSRTILMHRHILNITDSKVHTDHRDGNGCNNQRENIRIATRTQNATGFRTLRKDKTSKFRGVGWHKGCSKWFARIRVSRKLIYLGLFIKETEAAKAYDVASRKYFGDFASPNFPNQQLTKPML